MQYIVVTLDNKSIAFDDFHELMEYMDLYEGANLTSDFLVDFPDYPDEHYAPVSADTRYTYVGRDNIQ